MKHFILACLAIVFLTACPDGTEDESPEQPVDLVDISQVQLTSLIEIKPQQAKEMIDHIATKESICANASADIIPEELKRLLSAKGVTGMKLLRANHALSEPNEQLRNRPTFILAILMGSEARFYKPLRVCPPPDGSVCLEGLPAFTE